MDSSKIELSAGYFDPKLNSDSVLRSQIPKLEVTGVLNAQKYDSILTKFSVDSIKSGFKKELGFKNNEIKSQSDSLLSKGKSELKSAKPKASLYIRSQLKAIKPKGSISFGYEYGVLPFVVGGNYPTGGFKTEGNVSFLLAGVPLELTYFYTDIKNIVGLNNYFRISFDANRYKEQLGQTIDGKESIIKNQLSGLQLQQQQVMQKMEYLNLLQQSYNSKKLSMESLDYRPTLQADSLDFPSIDGVQDSSKINGNIPHLSTIGVGVDTSSLVDSIANYNKYMSKKDSVAGVYNNYKAKYDSISGVIGETQGKLDQIRNIKNTSGTSSNPYLSRFQNVLSYIKKFEIGLCNPTYSTFLVNNIPLQGINVELEKNNNYLAFTYGTTINNLLYNPNTIHGAMQTGRNLYNYFDFGNLESGRKIISVKGGAGQKEGTHLYAGVLIGKGRADYLHPSIDAASATKESNVVIELDGKYKLNNNLSFDLVYGKSSIKDENLTMETISNSFNEIFSAFRSNAILGRINLNVSKSSTKIVISTRWVDPYFKSFGLGFMRSDNLRYEIKVEQPITKKIKYTIAYRHEEDNLLRLFDYKNTLQSINNTLNLKLSRKLNIRLIYAPLFRELRNGDLKINDKNTIATAIVSYSPKMKKGSVQLNALYSRYMITGDSADINFENFTFTEQRQFRSGFISGVNLSWFKNNLQDTLNNDTYMAVIDCGYKSRKNHSFSIGLKSAYKVGLNYQYGFVVKASIKIYKGLYWEAMAEKILVGDYYNSFIIGQIQKFPYYCNTRLTLNF